MHALNNTCRPYGRQLETARYFKAKKAYAGVDWESIKEKYENIHENFVSNHGTIIRTGITCKKTLVICATQLAGGLLLKKLKYFEVMLNIFEFSRV